uniref:Uncharacterized protein n=1 Tax=Fagus sylvatica TaxID=28930 RepID=A0A2N9HYL3_FAGSY
MMEAILIDCVQNSLRHFMHRNDIFICERLCAQFPSEVIEALAIQEGCLLAKDMELAERGAREKSLEVGAL